MPTDAYGGHTRGMRLISLQWSRQMNALSLLLWRTFSQPSITHWWPADAFSTKWVVIHCPLLAQRASLNSPRAAPRLGDVPSVHVQEQYEKDRHRFFLKLFKHFQVFTFSLIFLCVLFVSLFTVNHWVQQAFSSSHITLVGALYKHTTSSSGRPV